MTFSKSNFGVFALLASFACLWARGESPATQLSVGMRLYGSGAESRRAQSRLAGTELEANLKHVFSPAFALDANAGLQAETGTSRAIENDEFRPRQALRLREGSFSWTPIHEIQLRAGALDQDRWEQPLLLSGQSFPALVQRAKFASSGWTFSASAQQAFATDSSLLLGANRTSNAPATFFLERASVQYEGRRRFRAETHLSHFAFENLSSSAAFPSRFSGNSVSGAGAANSRFQYRYQGFEAGASVGGHLGEGIEPSVAFSLIRNASAPTGNEAARGVAAIAWRLGTTLVTPSAEVFRIESDAAPAAFNDRALGHANRKGYGVGLAVSWNEGVEASARFVDARLLSPSSHQSDLQWFGLSLRTRYDVL